jgi:hypothetical protein
MQGKRDQAPVGFLRLLATVLKPPILDVPGPSYTAPTRHKAGPMARQKKRWSNVSRLPFFDPTGFGWL